MKGAAESSGVTKLGSKLMWRLRIVMVKRTDRTVTGGKLSIGGGPAIGGIGGGLAKALSGGGGGGSAETGGAGGNGWGGGGGGGRKVWPERRLSSR